MILALAYLALDEVKDLIDKLRATADMSQRYQLEYQLGRAAKPTHLPVLLREVDAGPEEVRPHFIRALRSIGGKDATAALKSIQGRYDWGSRGEVAYALKLLGEDSGMKYLVQEFPKPTMKREDRSRVVQYLFSYYYDSKDVPPVLRKVLEAETDDAFRTRLIDALVSHRDFECIALLRKIAAKESDPCRYDALAGLIKLTDNNALETTIAELEAGKIPLASLYRVLDALRGAATQEVADRLRGVLDKSTDTNTRVQIIRTLAALRDSKSLTLLHKLANESDAAVATAALDAILEMAGRSEKDNLKKLLEHDKVEIRLRAAEVLLGLDELQGLDVVKAELSNSQVTWRRRAATVLLTCRRKEAIDLMLRAMDDADVQVRTTASIALTGALSSLFPYIKFDLKKAGYDPTSEDPVLRGKALDKLKDWWTRNQPKGN